jgi:hypothetical protein
MNFRDLEGRPALPWQNPTSRRQHAELIAAYNPESLLKELHDADGKLEVLNSGTLKLTGAGNLPTAWHQAFVRDRHVIREMVGAS